MKSKLIEQGLIPLDKSWIIRMGVLDLINYKKDIILFLENQDNLSDDLISLKNAAKIWNSSEEVNVGESATLFRFLQFASWKLKLNKKFIKEGTLKNRIISDDSRIINYSIGDLLELDNKTSQWASASVISGNEEKIQNPPFKLKLTYDAVEHWNSQRNKNERWTPRYDETILKQAESFIEFIQSGKLEFTPRHSEDYCFSRAFNLLTSEEAAKIWPILKGHETNRILEMELQLNNFEQEKSINSNDHRIIQAIALLSISRNKQANFLYSNSVGKSWPQFWKFIDSIKNNNI